MGLTSSKSKSDEKKKAKKKAAAATVSDKDRAVLDLKNCRDRLKRETAKYEKDSVKLFNQAQKLLKAGEKKKAVMCMKLRKQRLKQLDSIEGQLMTVYELTESIESKSAAMNVFNALKVGKDALNNLNKQMSVDDVVTLMDEVADANAVAQEMSNALGGAESLDATEEDELEREMESLRAEMEVVKVGTSEKMGATTATTTTATTDVKVDLLNLPDVPDAAPTVSKEEEKPKEAEPKKNERVAVAA